MKKQKCLSLGPKLPDLGILGLKFEGRIIIFEISTFEFVCLQCFIWIILGWNFSALKFVKMSL